MSKLSLPPGMVKSASLGNRRATIRYRCAPATVGKVLSSEDQEMQLAWIIDLSLKGIGMQLVRPILSGRLIVVSLKTTDGSTSFDLSARVMYCNPIPHDEWSVGCELTAPLTPEQLDQLL